MLSVGCFLCQTCVGYLAEFLKTCASCTRTLCVHQTLIIILILISKLHTDKVIARSLDRLPGKSDSYPGVLFTSIDDHYNLRHRCRLVVELPMEVEIVSVINHSRLVGECEVKAFRLWKQTADADNYG